MAYDFIAIDFETANNNMASACSIGLVAVKNNEIVEEKYFLIQPSSLIFHNTNINIHGITPDDVKDSPLFPYVWNQIKHYFSGNTVVAHNAVFDMSILKNCLIEYSIEMPDFNYICSIPISTRACQDTGVGQSLEDRAKYFGIELEDHHNALADAKTCAKLIIECINRKKRKSFQAFINAHYSIPIKQFSDLNPLKQLKKGNKRSFEKIVISEISATNDNFDKSHSLFGKSIVLTGELKSMDRKEAMQRIVNVGGILKSGISRKTDYLVVGVQDITLVGEDGMSTKEEKAYALNEQGYNIKIIKEDEFLKLL